MQKVFIFIGIFFFGVSAVIFLTSEEGASPMMAIFFALLGVAFIVISAIPEFRRKRRDQKKNERQEKARYEQKKHVARHIYLDCENEGITELTDENREKAMKIAMNYAISRFGDLQSYFYLGKRSIEHRRQREREQQLAGKKK